MTTAQVTVGVFGMMLASYLVGSIPSAYLIVRIATGEDITTHGSGNVGAMNVRRATGSWVLFVVAMVADALKGFAPTLAAKAVLTVVSGVHVPLVQPWGVTLSATGQEWWTVTALWLPMVAVAGSVVGHNYSVWMALIKRRFARTGKGLATGGGALLAYDWRYFVAVVVVGLAVIAITRYFMAGQVAAAATLPVAAIVLRSPDWQFACAMAAVVIAAHWKRFIGLLQGREPKLYFSDGAGPRG
jgi:glycerol-3-phosphate acyltransferase PlsY